MNLIKIIILQCLCVLCVHAQIETDIDKIVSSEKNAFKNHQAFVSSTINNYGYDIIYHQLEVSIDPSVYAIEGAVTSIIQIDASYDSVVRFDCSDRLQIDSIKRGAQHLVYQTNDTDILSIHLFKSLNVGDYDTFTIFYHGIPLANGFGSFSQTFHDSIPNIWTLSEPYGARDWWPYKQSLSDKIDSIDIYIRCPKGQVAASNGLLVAIDSTELTTTIFHWKHRYPIATYLVAVSVTNYEIIPLHISFDSDSLVYMNFVYPENYINALDGILENIQVMHLYDSLFHPYPFMREKYGHAQFGWGGGMEHQTMTFVSEFSFELLAHELAHQWFGDKITCGNWQDIWLNEGFATYLSGLCYEHLLNGYYWPLFKKIHIEKVCSQPNGSVYIKDNEELSVARIFSSRLSYSKGAMFLHMLRWKMGDEAFFTGINAYLIDPDYAYDFCVSSQFQAKMEEAAGADLTEFFNDWLYGEGYPSYTIHWRQNLNSSQTQIKIDQATSDASVSFFEMPVPIRFYNSTQDTTIIFNHTENHQVFTIDLPFKADSAELDPMRWILQSGSSITNLSKDLLADNLTIRVSSTDISNAFSFEVSSEKAAKIEMYVLNLNGQKVLQEKFDIGFEKIQKSYATNALAKGIYILYIKAGNEEHSYKLIKSR